MTSDAKKWHYQCVYMRCLNKYTKNSNISFFKFPIKDEFRVREWIKSSGNLKLEDKQINELRYSRICQEHFNEHDIIVTSRNKHLTKTAVPIKYSDKEISPPPKRFCKEKVGEVSRTYEHKRKFEDTSKCLTHESDESEVSDRILNMPSSQMTPKCRKLRYKIRDLRKELGANKKKRMRLRKNLFAQTKQSIFQIVLSLLTLKSPAVKTFVTMQCFHKGKTPWTKAQQQLATSIYYKSPSTYTFLRNNLKFVLPSKTTINNWLKITNLKTGLDTELIKQLSSKAKHMSERERAVVLLMDEMSLKKDLRINSTLDKIEGYEDLGHLGKCNKLATTVLVFYLRGLFCKWKFPFCYFSSSGPTPKEKLEKIVFAVIQKLLSISFQPRAIVCDQGSNNRGTFSLLGASKVSPYFIVNGQKIYTIYDVPHLIKSIRNNLMNIQSSFLVYGRKISWADIVAVYEIDKRSTTRALHKITQTHLNPNTFQKMRVKYATQVLSHTVSAAIQTAVKLKQITSDTASDTAKFIESVNNIFDSLNSRHLKDRNKNKRPLSVFNKTPELVLEEGKKVFENISIISQNLKVKSNVYCVDGFIWTISAILSLWDDLKKEDIKYFPTSHLNQDPLENFFSVIRTRGGYNRYPTIQQFRISMQHNMHIRMQKDADYSNCEADEDMEYLELSALKNVAERELSKLEGHTQDSSHSKQDEPQEIEDGNWILDLEESPVPSLETCSKTYVAGYLAYWAVKKYNCNYCKSILIKSENDLFDPNETLIFYKDFGLSDIKYLKRPSDKFDRLVQLFLTKFVELYEKMKLNEMYTLKMNVQFKHLLNMFCQQTNWKWDCGVHTDSVITFFIKLITNRIHKNMIQETVCLGAKHKMRALSSN